MDNRQKVGLIVVIGLAVIVSSIVAVWSYQLGQSSLMIATPTPEAAAGQSFVSPPPVIVTNTPTATSSPTPTPGPTNTPTPTLTPTPIVVIDKITGLGRLETTEFAMQTVIDLADEPSNLWEQIFGTDQLMLMAEGEVVAGIDLAKIEPADIVVEGRRVKIILPPTEILYSRIDNDKTFVYERGAGFLIIPDKDLESRARQLAEEKLTNWAIERDIHKKARQAAQLQIENFLLSLGFTEIVIGFKEEPL